MRGRKHEKKAMMERKRENEKKRSHDVYRLGSMALGVVGLTLLFKFTFMQ